MVYLQPVYVLMVHTRVNIILIIIAHLSVTLSYLISSVLACFINALQ